MTHTATFYRWLGWFETNKKQVVYGAVVVIVLGTIVSFFVWRQAEKQKAAGHALARAFVPQITGSASRVDLANGLLKVVSDYPNSEAGAQALLMAAGTLFDQNKYAEAQAQFERFSREHRQSPFLAQALLGVAASLEAQGKTNEALTAYKNLVDRRSGEVVIPQAKWAMARIYDAQNKPELAYPLYEEVARSDSSSLGSYAGIRAEELRLKYPNLAPAPVVSTNAPALTLTNAAPPPAAPKTGK